MNIQRLLSVEPRDLSYAIELKKQPSCSVKLSNKTQDHIAFKVKTTSVGKYRVRPYIGNLSPGSSCDILVKVLNPFNTQHEDTFMMMGIVSSPGATMEDIQKLFKANVGLRVQKSILGVAYVLTPKVPQLVAQESTSSSRFETSVGELLDIRPSELRFPFEVKELSCSLQMSNMTNNHVGFKVRTTALDKYSVQPNIGIVLPRSTLRILAHTEILTNMKCEDKFIIKSIIASPFETPKDMFERRAGVVDKINLGVFYVPPQRWSYTEVFNGIRGINEIEPGEFYAPPSRGESRNFIQQFIGTTRAAYETEVEESFVRPSRSSYSEEFDRLGHAIDGKDDAEDCFGLGGRLDSEHMYSVSMGFLSLLYELPSCDFRMQHSFPSGSFQASVVRTKRWNKAVNEDECWVDPFGKPAQYQAN
ncbi:vesicle-associated protein 1-4 [Phtheirospermum japonicum]|uniref:Vesicle-associated protein 1-4 n=1 Tax=Phtheirospermum japonicum TaxID=374723 RepID=A0A830D0A5_9LAMI|nr:vesicle-associated protein 1-4 [Phtheirospermum japonicum]